MFVEKMKKFFQDDGTFLKIESLMYEGKKFSENSLRKVIHFLEIRSLIHREQKIS